jgi:autophagy-related protein 101
LNCGFLSLTSTLSLVLGILHAIFFHRYFPPVLPNTREVLDLTLPHIEDVELETMIEQRTTALVRQLDADRNSGMGSGGSGGRGQIMVQFFERKRRKAWLVRGDEEVCWESWTVKVTVAEPRTESGKLHATRLFPTLGTASRLILRREIYTICVYKESRANHTSLLLYRASQGP